MPTISKVLLAILYPLRIAGGSSSALPVAQASVSFLGPASGSVAAPREAGS